VRKRPAGIEGERREHGENFLFKILAQPFLLARFQVLVVVDANSFCSQLLV
jgi:hypothetical protein